MNLKETLMKKVIILIALSAFALCAKAQEEEEKQPSKNRETETLFKSTKMVGGYLGFNTKYSELNGQEALFTGGELSLIAGRKLNIGIEGYGLVNPIKFSQESSNTNYLNMGYGGFHLEPVLFSKKLLHLTFPVLLGAGGIAETQKSYLNDDFYDVDFTEDDLISTDFFMIAEPGVMLELNVFRFMRLGAGISHRFVGGIETSSLSNDKLSGWSGQLALRLGWF